MEVDVRESAIAFAQTLNPTIEKMGADIGVKLLVGCTIIAIAIYAKK